jgi:beta-glucosidase/6-phospho-beta-glucosidase/beta-galactosidase
MKIKHFLMCISIICLGLIGTAYTKPQNKASITLSESDNHYSLKAKYDKAKTRKVQEYMTESLKSTGFKFTNTQLDAQLALTGGINFYIKSYEGELVLKFDKRKNNADDYTKFKKMCEGIKTIVQEN